MEHEFAEIIRLAAQIAPPDADAMRAARRRWDSIAKPLHSLGLLEDALVRIAGIARSERIDLSRRGVAVFCADNGVVAQGVAQTDRAVTAVVTANFARGRGSVNRMAAVAGADVIPVDIGVAADLTVEGLRVHKLGYGTADITRGPAMTARQAADAVGYGIALVRELKEAGYRILATGEMGIGNTTTSSAIVSVLLGADPARVTGRGAGLTDEGLSRKIAAIRRAVLVNRPDPADPLGVLAKLGGFDIAGLCGVFLGGALYGVPVLIDGFITLAAALVAARVAPVVREYLLPSHLSEEPAAGLVMEELGLCPLISCRMHLGEGTGAVACLPLLDMAAALYGGMDTFAGLDIAEYYPFGGDQA